MKRRKVIISAIVVAVVVMAGGGGVYAYNYHQEQQKVEEQKKAEEKERLEQEDQKRKEEEEKKRLEDARKVIQKELDDLEMQIVALYTDEQKKMPVEGITQDGIDAASAKLETLKEKYKENPDVSSEQSGKLQELEKEIGFASLMNEVVTKYNSLYPNGQLVAIKTETDEAVTALKDKLKELEGSKSDFFKVYSEKLSEAENSFVFQRSVQEAVNMIYNKEAGSMVAGVTRQQYNDVLAAVDTMPDNELKAELRQYLTVVDQTLIAQEEAAKTQKASSGNGSSGRGNSSSGNSNGGSSSLGSGSSSGGNNSSGSGSSSGGSSSSGNGSSGGSSSGSGSSSGGSGDSDGHGSWEGTVIGGGQTNDGGTVEWGTW